MVQLTGAGIFIIEKYKNNICFTVFKTKKGYNEPGGIIDKGETHQETACRECLEETANLIKIFPVNLAEYVIIDKYIAYIVYLEGIMKKDYLNNIKITKQKCPHQWNETYDITRIPINNINFQKYSPVKDFNNETVILRMRTYKIMKAIEQKIPQLIKKKPLQLQRYRNNTSHKCLSDTITYTIKDTEQLALFIAPDIQFTKYKKLKKCDKIFGGLHIKITDFDYNHPIELLDQLKKNQKFWNPEIMEQHENKIIFRSNTLDNLSIKLQKLGFRKIKGLIFGKSEWFMTYDCIHEHDLLKILAKSTWSIYLIKVNENKKIKWKQLFRL